MLFRRFISLSLLISGLCAAVIYLRSLPHSKSAEPRQAKVVAAEVEPPLRGPLPAPGWGTKYGNLPLSFVPNRDGGIRGGIEFLSHGLGYSVFLSPTKADVVSPASGSFPVSNRVVELEWLGANSAPRKMEGREPQPGVSNYLLGNDRSRWHRRLGQFSRVKAPEVYPGIDVTYYGSQQQLEFDLTLHAGADPDLIRLGVKGAYKVQLNAEGEVSLLLHEGEVRLQKAEIYQMRGKARQKVAGRYVLLAEHQIGLKLGAYDHTRALVIDPVLSYAMMFGGVHGFSNDLLTALAIDANGNAYVAGTTCAPDFQVTPDAFQTVGGLAANYSYFCKDVFVTKINSSATALLYSTYLGGSQVDVPMHLAIDSSGSAYVTGGTQSSDFPVTAGAYDTTFNNTGSCASHLFSGCTDAFVTKLSADGSSLLYSTFLGGSNVDFGTAIALDSSNNAYVGGATNSTDLPVSSNAVQKSYGGGTCNAKPCFDGFLAKLSADGKSLIYLTYLGGNDDDFILSVTVDSSGSAFVAGGTGSTNFPITANAYQTHRAGTTDQTDGFFTKLNSSASQLLYSTYLGGSDTDYATSLEIDSAGNAYVVGATGSSDFPTTAGVFQSRYAGPSPSACSFTLLNYGTAACGDVFVSKLNPQKSGTASLVWSTYLGGSSDDAAFSVAVDSTSHVWLTGLADSTNFPTTPDAYRSATSGGYLSELSADGTKLVFSTMLGGIGMGVAVDASGAAYLSGSGSPPSTPGVYPSVGANFIAKFSPGIAPQAQLSPSSLTFGSQPIGSTSPSQPVVLTNTGGSPLNIAIVADTYSPANYAQTNNCSLSVAPDASCTIDVTFNPMVAGNPGAFLTVYDNAPGSPHGVSLVGSSATATAAVLSPNLLSFGDQAVGTQSPVQTVQLTNKGTTTLTISSISATAPFSRTTTCGGTLAAKSSCKISVKFSPGSTGAFSGTLSVMDNAAGSLQTVSLFGNGVQGPAVFLTPASLIFSPQAPGTTSSAKKVLLYNTGDATLDLSEILVRDDFAETTTCGVSLAPGGKCTFSVVYKPRVAGPHSGSMVIANNANNQPQVVPLTGLGPAIYFSGPGNFGTVPVGQISAVKSLYVTSGGTSSLHISNIALGGTDPADFAFTAGGTCKNGTVLKVGTQCTVNLVFQPTMAGTRSADVLFTDDAANSPQSVPLQGTGQ
jgi:hypothetical protein